MRGEGLIPEGGGKGEVCVRDEVAALEAADGKAASKGPEVFKQGRKGGRGRRPGDQNPPLPTMATSLSSYTFLISDFIALVRPLPFEGPPGFLSRATYWPSPRTKPGTSETPQDVLSNPS